MDTSPKVIDYIKNVAEYVKNKGRQHQRVPDAGAVLFPPSVQYTVIEKLSGGEKTPLPLKIPRECTECPDPDEPTNDLDIQIADDPGRLS